MLRCRGVPNRRQLDSEEVQTVAAQIQKEISARFGVDESRDERYKVRPKSLTGGGRKFNGRHGWPAWEGGDRP
jgi:hypothetical protein